MRFIRILSNASSRRVFCKHPFKLNKLTVHNDEAVALQNNHSLQSLNLHQVVIVPGFIKLELKGIGS